MEELAKQLGPMGALVLLLLLQGAKWLRQEQHRKKDMNGENPIVQAIDRLGGSLEKDAVRTREKIDDGFQAQREFTKDHQDREERSLEKMTNQLEAIKNRLPDR